MSSIAAVRGSSSKSWWRVSVAMVVALLAASVVEAQIPVARAIGGKRQTRESAKLSPSSGLDARAALVAANTIASHIAGARVLTVMATGSMRPTFDEKAFLVIEPTPFDELEIGDVVTFQMAKVSAPIVHRIFEKRGDAFWTRGDHNSRPDSEYVTRANYGMRVVAVIYGREDSSRFAAVPAKNNATAMMN